MKINSVINTPFKGIVVKKISKPREAQNENIKNAKSQIDLLSILAKNTFDTINWNSIKDRKAYKMPAEDYHSGEAELLQQIKNCGEIGNQIDKVKSYYSKMANIIKVASEENKQMDKANKVHQNQAKLNSATKTQNASEKLSRIAGYDYEIGILKNEFINKVRYEEEGDNSQDIPGSVLFFGPNRNGKTIITYAVAEETDANLVDLVWSEYTENNLMSKINDIAKQSEENYNLTGKRTIIFIDEADVLLNKKQTQIKEFYDFIKTCSKDYHCSVFAATNKPLELGADFSDADIFPIAMSIDPANHENKSAIVDKILKTFKVEDISPETIVSEIEKQEVDRAFSNEQIVNITWDIGEAITLGKTDKKDVINYMAQNILPGYSPDITKEEVSKFQKEYDIIINGLGDDNENN